MNERDLIGLVMAALGSLGFAMLFNVRGKKLAISALGGLLSWGAYLLAYAHLAHMALCYALAAMLAGLFSLVMARVLRAPSTEFLVPALVPLIPGGALYYAMFAAVTGDWDAFLLRGAEALTIAAAISVGQAVAPSLDLLLRGGLIKRRHKL
ncbi:MAG: threonine/serine exporter family protein [Clostridia bacterium]